jgi:hypothetical protein
MGQVDYEEWFESVDIGSVPVSAVAFVVADLYRDLFEVWIFRSSPLIFEFDGWGVYSELDRGYERPARNGRSGPATMAWESALASCDSPDFIRTTTPEFIQRSWW